MKSNPNSKSTFPKTLFFLFFTLQTLLTYSQQFFIQGSIYDSTTLEPVPFATLNAGQGKGTISDETGFFRFSTSLLQKTDTITFTSIGYSSKKMPVEQLNMVGHETIYLTPNVYEMNTVVVKGKKRRVPGKKRILRNAIAYLHDNYATDTLVYEGYYREYIKDNEEYLNLFESILYLEEFMNDTLNNFEVNLLFSRANHDFTIDSALSTSYDNDTKFVPLTTFHVADNNELLQLMLIDPIKNIRGESVSFIDNFREDFLVNHKFSNPKLSYLDGNPYYYISFEDRRYFTLGYNKIRMNGGIYINAEDYGIKKITYLATLSNNNQHQKLFELNIEYAKMDEKYLLSYISYNNLFRNQCFSASKVEIIEGELVFNFTRPLSSNALELKNSILVHYFDEKQSIDSVQVNKNQLILTFDKSKRLGRDLTQTKKLISPVKKEDKVNLEKQVFAHLDIELKNVFDTYGNPLSNKKFKDYYQYREFFVHEVHPEKQLNRDYLMDKTKPVFSNGILPHENVDTTWINSPLIDEVVSTAPEIEGFTSFNRFISNKNSFDANHANEMIYIHTDREVYAPGDTMWFKGYVRNDKFLTASNLSQSFFIKLVNKQGNIVAEEKFIIKNGAVYGQVFLENDLEDGFYFLNGNSSWQKNFGPEKTYTKKLLIQREKRKEIKMVVAYDKEAYFPGDTMFMELRCMDEYNRELSGVNYRYRITDGASLLLRGTGETSDTTNQEVQFTLPAQFDTLPEISIHSNYKHQGYHVVYNMPVNYFIDVDFFPEGGHLIKGTESQVAFKAVTRYGMPADIKGNILNRDGKILAEVPTIHDGMGLFTLPSYHQDSCYLQITEPTTFNGKYYLPAASETGWQLSVQNRLGKTIAHIENIRTKNDSALLTVMVRDKLVFYQTMKTRKKSNVVLPMEDFPAGIAVVTLFDNNLTPQAERLIFVPGKEEVQPQLITDRPLYQPRDSVILELTLNGADMDKGSYSLSVIDEQLCTTDLLDEPNIKTSFLLTPEIKGKIHNPNYYLSTSNEQVKENLELLLLTQGWRDYKTHMENVMEHYNDVPENMETISGFLMKEPFGRQQQPTKGELIVFFGGQSQRIPVGEDGQFSFIPEYSYNHNSGVFVSGLDKNEKPHVSVELKPKNFKRPMNDFLAQVVDSMHVNAEQPVFTYNRLQENFSYDIGFHHWIDEVVISKSVEKEYVELSDLVESKLTVDTSEFNRYANVGEIVAAYEYYIGSQYSYYIDGFEVDYNYASRLNTNNIATMNLVKGWDAIAIYGLWPKEGVLDENEDILDFKRSVVDIKLKPISEWDHNYLWKNPVSIKPFSTPKQFYQPKYDTEEKRNSQIPDLRKTIHWQPDITFNEAGKARIKIYNGDRYTRIKCILEGITNSGIPVFGEGRYEVDIK